MCHSYLARWTNNSLDLVTESATGHFCSLSPSMLDRFCYEVLPRIHYKVRSLILEGISMERILVVGDYPNLFRLTITKLSSSEMYYHLTGTETSPTSRYPRLSLTDCSSGACFSSILVELCVNLVTIDDCLCLLDGRLIRLRALIVKIDDIDNSLLNIDTTVNDGEKDYLEIIICSSTFPGGLAELDLLLVNFCRTNLCVW